MFELGLIVLSLCLILSNLFTIWFYQKQIQVLIDKAMSRSYTEYVQSKNLEQVDNLTPISTQETPKVEDDAVLNELNQIFS